MAWRGLDAHAAPPRPPQPPPGAVFGLRVLASGSSGNASLLYVPGDSPRVPARLSLIDAGISPTRLRKILAIDGLRLLQIDDIIYTHLDRDHAHPGWCSASGCRAVRRIHRRHIRRAERDGHAYKRCEVFEDVFDLGESVRVSPVLSSHDQFGVSVFRFDIGGAGGSRASMGFATDVGTITDGWPDHVRGVDVLAIESNYCPDLQIASDRPEFLKQRIMGGSGHLSNQESAVAAQHIAPEQRLVLLHLSQQCNSAELAQRAHAVHTRANPRLEVTVTTQNEPTPWLWVTACRPRPMGTPRVTREPSLFDVASDAP